MADGGYGLEFPDVIVSAPAYAEVTVTAAEVPAPEQPRESQSVTTQLNTTMAKLASTVTAPVFGTTAGEWTVFSLARGGYFAKDNAYFTDYYNRIVETVNTTAASVNMGGALHKNKSTENSRLIVALSALGIDATSVGDWNLVEAYSTNGFSWIQKQGFNGTIWALIALDSNDYATSDPTIRQQCVDALLAAQHDDGGWALQANKTFASDPAITGMALTALYPYRDQSAVAEACAEAIACLSAMQHENGTFASGGSECSESCAWVIVAATTWGINPDTDSRFIKNGNSVVDGLLAHYLPDSATFQHIIGAGSNAMASDQSCYALVAYDRFLNNKAALYDYSDVTFDAPDEGGTTPPTGDGEDTEENADIHVSLGLPETITYVKDTTFNALVTVDKWDNAGGYKLVDFIMTIPEGLTVTEVKTGDRLSGGSISYNLEAETNKLRCVYFDSNENSDLIITGTNFPAEIFNIQFKISEVKEVEKLDFAITGMSIKLNSDAFDEDSMVVVKTEPVQVDPNDPNSGTTGGGSGRVYSDGGGSGLDQYQTGPVPEGKPLPVEPENQQVNSEKSYTCTFSIECSTILNNLDILDPDKLEMVPSGGSILATTTVTFYEGESVFDVLQRVCRNSGIHMEAEWTPIYNSAYVQGIHNLYEFDCGALSGWMYRVNGWYPNYGSSRYQLQEGDVVEWRYTCDLGQDVGGAHAVTG